jgi:hypothetical protein
MTANRIGLSNAEEVYLGRIQERAIADLQAFEAEHWDRLHLEFLKDSRRDVGSLRDFTPTVLQEFFASMIS